MLNYIEMCFDPVIFLSKAENKSCFRIGNSGIIGAYSLWLSYVNKEGSFLLIRPIFFRSEDQERKEENRKHDTSSHHISASGKG